MVEFNQSLNCCGDGMCCGCGCNMRCLWGFGMRCSVGFRGVGYWVGGLGWWFVGEGRLLMVEVMGLE